MPRWSSITFLHYHPCISIYLGNIVVVDMVVGLRRKANYSPHKQLCPSVLCVVLCGLLTEQMNAPFDRFDHSGTFLGIQTQIM